MRAVYDETAQYDKVWWFAANQRRLTYFEERKAGGRDHGRKRSTWAVTPYRISRTSRKWRRRWSQARRTRLAAVDSEPGSVRQRDDVGGMGLRLSAGVRAEINSLSI